MSVDPPQADSDLESWRERVRRLPGVIVHRLRTPTPFVPDVRVINVTSMHDLIGESAAETNEIDSIA